MKSLFIREKAFSFLPYFVRCAKKNGVFELFNMTKLICHQQKNNGCPHHSRTRKRCRRIRRIRRAPRPGTDNACFVVRCRRIHPPRRPDPCADSVSDELIFRYSPFIFAGVGRLPQIFFLIPFCFVLFCFVLFCFVCSSVFLVCVQTYVIFLGYPEIYLY